MCRNSKETAFFHSELQSCMTEPAVGHRALRICMRLGEGLLYFIISQVHFKRIGKTICTSFVESLHSDFTGLAVWQSPLLHEVAWNNYIRESGAPNPLRNAKVTLDYVWAIKLWSDLPKRSYLNHPSNTSHHPHFSIFISANIVSFSLFFLRCAQCTRSLWSARRDLRHQRVHRVSRGKV